MVFLWGKCAEAYACIQAVELESLYLLLPVYRAMLVHRLQYRMLRLSYVRKEHLMLRMAVKWHAGALQHVHGDI